MSSKKSLTKSEIMAALANPASRLFIRVFRDGVKKKGKSYVGKFRLNATRWLEAPIDTVRAESFLASTDKATLCEVPVKLLGEAIKDDADNVTYGGNTSKRGHVYLNGINMAEAIKLGEMPAHTTKKDDANVAAQ